jgi:hypothetical protein
MGRKTGKDAIIHVEVGTTFYSMAALSSVSSPAADVNKKFLTSAEFISPQEDLEPVVRLDGVVSGLTLTPGSGYNEVDYSAGTVYIKGSLVTVTAGTVTDIPRPLVSGNVRVSALTVDSNGAVNRTSGAEGTSNTTRGSAGAPPFLPVDEVLIGYVTATYYGGSASGASTIASGEINDETRERSTIPSYEVNYHDGSGDNAENVGCIVLATALPTIHAADKTGPGTDVRNLYASYYASDFEQLSGAYDWSFDEDIATIASKAYGDSAEEKALSTPSWSGTGSAYYDKVKDVLNLVKNSKRWVKYFPDRDETAYWAGRAILKVSRTMPVEDNLTATVTIDGSGELYPKDS